MGIDDRADLLHRALVQPRELLLWHAANAGELRDRHLHDAVHHAVHHLGQGSVHHPAIGANRENLVHDRPRRRHPRGVRHALRMRNRSGQQGQPDQGRAESLPHATCLSAAAALAFAFR